MAWTTNCSIRVQHVQSNVLCRVRWDLNKLVSITHRYFEYQNSTQFRAEIIIAIGNEVQRALQINIIMITIIVIIYIVIISWWILCCWCCWYRITWSTRSRGRITWPPHLTKDTFSQSSLHLTCQTPLKYKKLRSVLIKAIRLRDLLELMLDAPQRRVINMDDLIEYWRWFCRRAA